MWNPRHNWRNCGIWSCWWKWQMCRNVLIYFKAVANTPC
jgi:hypothetical protein